MNKRQIPVFLFRWVAPLVVLGCAGLFVYSMGTQKRPERKKPPVRKSIPVELIRPRPHSGTLDIVVSGVAIPYRDVQLAARVSGEVIFKSESLSPGRIVQEGELLLRIDPADYQIEVARLEQEIAKVQLDIEQLNLAKENTQRVLAINQDIVAVRKRDVQRLQRLLNANATSPSEADAIELEFLSAVQETTTQENEMRMFASQAKSLQTTLELASLQLDRARLDLERTEIKAPFAGVVIENHIEQNAVLASGAAVATIEDTSKVEVRSSLRGEEMAFLQGDGYELPQVPVTVEYDRAGQTFVWDAVLSRQDGLGIDKKTRTLPVRICVSNPTQSTILPGAISPNSSAKSSPRLSTHSLALLRGMFVRVRLHCTPQRPLVIVPESVIRPGKTVWVMRDGELQIEPVRIARIEKGNAYIDLDHSSLIIDERIVSSPVPNAKSGLAVSVAGAKKPRGGTRQKMRPASPGSEANQNSRLNSSEVMTVSATASAPS